MGICRVFEGILEECVYRPLDLKLVRAETNVALTESCQSLQYLEVLVWRCTRVLFSSQAMHSPDVVDKEADIACLECAHPNITLK